MSISNNEHFWKYENNYFFAWKLIVHLYLELHHYLQGPDKHKADSHNSQPFISSVILICLLVSAGRHKVKYGSLTP